MQRGREGGRREGGRQEGGREAGVRKVTGGREMPPDRTARTPTFLEPRAWAYREAELANMFVLTACVDTRMCSHVYILCLHVCIMCT